MIQTYSDDVDGQGRGRELHILSNCDASDIEHGTCFSVTFVQDQSFSGKAIVFDLEDAVAAAKQGYPRILALVQDTLEVATGSIFHHLESKWIQDESA